MTDSTIDSTIDTAVRRRAAAAALMAGGIVFLAAEFVAAAAWTNPPYSYTYHFISNLGVHGPSTLFGQYMYSPLAWVMNTGFFLFGLAALAGVVLLRGPSGRRRTWMIATAALLAAGGVVLAFFPGSGEALEDGTGDYHALGAFAAFVAGNVLAILLGGAHRSLGLSGRLGRILVTLGIVGFVSLALYVADIGSNAGILIGLVERGAVYPTLISLIIVGAAVRRPRTSTD